MPVEIPVVNAGTQYVDSLNMAWLSTSTISISSGAARDSTGQNDIILDSTVTLSTAVNGVNGLDSGTIANATMYHVFVVGDSSQNFPTCGLISTSLTTPILPYGYDMFRRIGSFKSDATALIIQFTVGGNGRARFYNYGIKNIILNGGSSTTPSQIALNAIVPITACMVSLNANYTPAAATNIASLRAADTVSAFGVIELGCGVAGLQVVPVQVPTDPVTGAVAIQYFVTAAGDNLTLYLTGYIDCL